MPGLDDAGQVARLVLEQPVEPVGARGRRRSGRGGPRPCAAARRPRPPRASRRGVRDARQRRAAPAGGRGTAPAPRRRGAGSGSPCRGSRARPGRRRGAAARTPRGRAPRTCFGIEHALSTPTPCSPVSEPPASMHASRIASASSLARSASPCGLVVEHERVQVAVARVEDVPDAEPVLGRARRSGAAPRAAACAGRRRPGRSSRARCDPSPGTRLAALPDQRALGVVVLRPASRTSRDSRQIASTAAASSSTCTATPSSSTSSTAPAPSG